MFLRIFEDELLVRKIELSGGKEYRIGSDNQCEIRLDGVSQLEGVLYDSKGKWFFRKVKDKEGIEVYSGYELIFGNYHLKFAAPILATNDEVEKTVVYQMNDATIVINKQNNPKLIFLDGEFKGKEVEIDKPIFTIGRIAGNDLVIPDPGVSKRHSRIVRKNEKFYIEDFDSTNGIYINGEKVEKGELKSGDTLEIGPAKIQFWMGEKLYKPGKKFFSGEKTIVKTEGSNKRVIILIILILLGAGFLFLPTGKKKKTSARMVGDINSPVTVNVSSDNSPPIPPPSPVEKQVPSQPQPQPVADKKTPPPEQPETRKSEPVDTHSRRPTKNGLLKKKKSPVTIKKKVSRKKIRENVNKWWVNRPCSDIWSNRDRAKRDFGLSADLRSKVKRCAEVEIKDYLEKKDFKGAMRVYNTVGLISGGKFSSLSSLFDPAVKEMYRQAYLLEDVDPDTAKKIYRRIVNITPPGTSYHKKALNRLR